MASQKRQRSEGSITSYFRPQVKGPAPPPRPQNHELVAYISRKFALPVELVREVVRAMLASDARLPFMTKYAPKTEGEVMDRDAAEAVKGFLRGFEAGEQCALLLVGPSGCGKTSLVRAVAKSLGLILLEMSAKEPRHSQALMRVLGEATQTRKIEAVSRASVVLLDDVDAVFDCDKGFHRTVCDLIAHTKLAVIMTAIDPPAEFTDRSDVLTIWLKPILEAEALLKMTVIAHAERLQIPQSSFRALYAYLGVNMGRVLNCLQLQELDLVLGLQCPVVSLSLAGGEVEVRSVGANWLTDSSSLDPWLDFLFRNQQCLSFSQDDASALLDVLCLLDGFSARIGASREVEKFAGKNLEAQEKYGLRNAVAYLDDVATRNLQLSEPLKLRCFDVAPQRYSSRTRKRQTRKARKRPVEPEDFSP